MGLTRTLQIVWTDGGHVLPATVSVEGNRDSNLDTVIDPGQVNLSLDFHASPTKIKLLHILSDKVVAVRLNSPQNPVEFTLVAGVPVLWADGMPYDLMPLKEPVAALVVTNPGELPARLQIRCLLAA